MAGYCRSVVEVPTCHLVFFKIWAKNTNKNEIVAEALFNRFIFNTMSLQPNGKSFTVSAGLEQKRPLCHCERPLEVSTYVNMCIIGSYGGCRKSFVVREFEKCVL